MSSDEESGVLLRINPDQEPQESTHEIKPSKGSPAARYCKSILFGFLSFLSSNYFNILLACVPFSVLSLLSPWGPIALFVLSFLSIIPLNWLCSWLIGQVNKHINQRDGEGTVCSKIFLALVHFIFGNAVELFLGFFLLLHNEIAITRSLIFGTLIARLLLTPALSIILASTLPKSKPSGDFESGSSLKMNMTKMENDNYDLEDDDKDTSDKFTGNVITEEKSRYESLLTLRGSTKQGTTDDNYFNSIHGYAQRTLAILSITLLLAVIGCSLPSLVALADIGSTEGVIRLSRWVSICLFVLSCFVLAYLIKKWPKYSKLDNQQFSEQLKVGPIMVCVLSILTLAALGFESYSVSLVIQSVTMNWGITRTFAGAVLLPVATRTSAHITSVRQTLNLSLLFSVTSQISASLSLILFVIPVLIMVSWVLSAAHLIPYDESLSLDFGLVPVVVIIFASLFHVFLSTTAMRLIANESSILVELNKDDDDEEDSLGGSSTREQQGGQSIAWLIGLAMFTLYLIIVIVFFYHP